jgi:hypothetical protein
MVERSLTFTKEIAQEILQDDEYFTINGENGEQEMEGPTQNEPLTDVEATDTLQNAGQAEEMPKPVNPTLPTARHSERKKEPSRYIRDLQSGEFTTGSNTEKIPKGIQLPTLDEDISGLAMLTMMGTEGGLEPRNLVEAKWGPDWLRWKEGMEEELSALEAYKTWEIMDDPKNINIVGCRWTFVLKKDSSGNITRYKARLVAQGYSQVPGIDFFDTYTPVTKMVTIHMTLTFAARRDHEIHQVNIKNVFLNGKFEEGEIIYMKLPPGIELTKEKGKVLHLLKPLYGLRQSARHWYKCLWGVLYKELKMKKCEVDQAAFYWCEGEDTITIVVHVDDLTIVTSNEKLMGKVKSALKGRFKISDMGEIHWILGFEVKGTEKDTPYLYRKRPISDLC